MKKHNGWKIAAVYTAVILGAGFASGQELLKYFVGFGMYGAWGLAAAGVLFAAVGWAVLDICRKEGLRGYGAFIRHLLGNKLGAIAEGVVAAFLCVLFTTMLAAAGATVRQGFGLPFTAGAAVTGLVCFLVLMFDLDGLVKLNTILAPFMVAGGIFIGVFTFFNRTEDVFAGPSISPGWILAAVIYASYNLVTGIPVLAAAAKLADGKKACRIGGVMGGIALTLLGLCLALPLFLHYQNIASAEIPLLWIIMGNGPLFTGLYLAVLLCAILTTAVSNAFAFLEWLCARIKVGKKTAAALLCLLAVLAAHVGFSNFVGYAYPLFGLLGIFEIAVVLLSWRRK